MTNKRKSTCCLPSEVRGNSIDSSEILPLNQSSANNILINMVRLEGEFLMGNSGDDGFPEDGEDPVRITKISPYYIDDSAVSNSDFTCFVSATGYQTEAERFGWSFVFHEFISKGSVSNVSQVVKEAPWWWKVEGADWRHPGGSETDLEGMDDHPVVHISWSDADAYARWSGKRLPTEAEWEYAARGGLAQNKFPWGNVLTPGGKYQCNIWQGNFPDFNTEADGYAGTAPVRSFDPNRYGLFNMSGNIWEWCSDWFSPNFHRDGPSKNPTGPLDGETKVIKGGSYLCHASYCNRYRVAARSSTSPDSSTGHMGFRCVKDVDNHDGTEE